MRKKLIFGLLAICCCGAFLVGCNKDEGASPTPTAKTPIQTLNESVNVRFIEAWIAINARATNTDLSALANRVGTLEGSITPDLTAYTAKDTELEGRLAGLESLNISDTFSDILAQIAYLELQLGTTPTPTPTGATPTPTPTPTPIVYCGIHRPSAVYPTGGDVNVQNGSVLFQWTEAINAVRYEFWFGTDSSSMTKVKEIDDFSVTNYLHPVPLANTYYFWKIVVTDACGNVQTDSWWFRTQ
jgi:hypothetical protein